MRTLSPTSLENLAACPMYWFFSRILGLAEPEVPVWEIGSREEGQWVHAALARFFDPAEYTPGWSLEQAARRLERCIEQTRQAAMAQGLGGHPSLWRVRQPVIRVALQKVVQKELDQMQDYLPQAVERDFGPPHQAVSIPQAQGPPLFLQGRLDRLDKGPQGQIRITDYKHTKNLLTLKSAVDQDALGGYRLSAAHISGCGPGHAGPGGGGYGPSGADQAYPAKGGHPGFQPG